MDLFREIKTEDIKEQAWEVCKDFLGGPWKNISAEELRIFKLKGGVINGIFRIAIPEVTPTEDPSMPKEVLFRQYGPLQEDQERLVRETAIFVLLSERKLGPKLHGLFSNGRLEEFIPSHTLSSDEMRLYAPSVARLLAKMHALDVPLKKVPEMLPEFNKWTDVVKKSYDNNPDLFMPFDQSDREFKWIKEEIVKTNSPVVFCHNDLKGGNILYREDISQEGNPNLILIDYELASYNYREFDIAGYFAECCLDYDTPDYPHFQIHTDNIPSRQQQVEFLRAYFDQFSKEGIQLNKPVEEEIESVLKRIHICACLAHFKAIMWGMIMTSTTSSNDFGYREFVEVRKTLYNKAKEQHLTLFYRQANSNSESTL